MRQRLAAKQDNDLFKCVKGELEGIASRRRTKTGGEVVFEPINLSGTDEECTEKLKGLTPPYVLLIGFGDRLARNIIKSYKDKYKGVFCICLVRYAIDDEREPLELLYWSSSDDTHQYWQGTKIEDFGDPYNFQNGFRLAYNDVGRNGPVCGSRDSFYNGLVEACERYDTARCAT